MSIALVQKCSGSSGAKTTQTTVTATWGSATTTGNLLVAIMGWRDGGNTITPPTGWTQIGSTVGSTDPFGAMFYTANAASQSGTKTWTLSSGSAEICLFMAEYSGCATSTPLDQHNSNDGSGGGTNCTTGSVTTSFASELLVGLIHQCNFDAEVQPNFSSPQNSFTLEGTVSFDSGLAQQVSTLGLLDRVVSSTGSYSSGVTSDQNEPYVGFISSFKGGGPQTASGSATLVEVATVTARGKGTHLAVDTVVEVAKVTAKAVGTFRAVAGLHEASTLSATSNCQHKAIAQLTEASLIQAVGSCQRQGNASLHGNTTLAAVGRCQRNATATLTEVARISAKAYCNFHEQLNITEVTKVHALGGIPRKASAALHTSSTISGSGTSPIVPASAALVGSSALQATGLRNRFGSAALKEVTALVAVGTGNHQDNAALKASSKLSATGICQHQDSAGLLVSSNFGHLAKVIHQGVVGTLADQSSITANATRTKGGKATLKATTTVQATLGGTHPDATALKATSTLKATAKGIHNGNAKLTEASQIKAVGSCQHKAKAALQEVSLLVGRGLRTRFGVATLQEQSNLTATGLRTRHPTVTMRETSTLSAVGTVQHNAAATLGVVGFVFDEGSESYLEPEHSLGLLLSGLFDESSLGLGEIVYHSEDPTETSCAFQRVGGSYVKNLSIGVMQQVVKMEVAVSAKFANAVFSEAVTSLDNVTFNSWYFDLIGRRMQPGEQLDTGEYIQQVVYTFNCYDYETRVAVLQPTIDPLHGCQEPEGTFGALLQVMFPTATVGIGEVTYHSDDPTAVSCAFMATDEEYVKDLAGEVMQQVTYLTAIVGSKFASDAFGTVAFPLDGVTVNGIFFDLAGISLLQSEVLDNGELMFSMQYNFAAYIYPGNSVVPGAAKLVGSSALVGSGTKTKQGAASLVESSTVVATGTKTKQAGAALHGVATILATGNEFANFSPLNGSPLFYADMSLATLYTSSGGTVPAVNQGDLVGYVGDMSGNGNNAKSVTDSNRMTLDITSSGVNGLAAINGNGTTSWLALTTPLVISGKFTAWYVGSWAAAGSACPMFGGASHNSFVGVTSNVAVVVADDGNNVSHAYTGSAGSLACRFRRDASNVVYFNGTGTASEITLGTKSGTITLGNITARTINSTLLASSTTEFAMLWIASDDLVTNNPSFVTQFESYITNRWGVSV